MDIVCINIAFCIYHLSSEDRGGSYKFLLQQNYDVGSSERWPLVTEQTLSLDEDLNWALSHESLTV